MEFPVGSGEEKKKKPTENEMKKVKERRM